MGKGKAAAPWTWEEISNLHGEDAKAFMKTYGDRGVAALLASGHPPGTWKAECPYQGCEPCVSTYMKHKTKCPMDNGSEWRKGGTRRTCSEASMEVYARMIAQLGLLPEGQ